MRARRVRLGRSGSSDAAGAKTGGPAGTLTITVADSQPAGHPSNLPLDEFARQVHSLSNGSMTVKVLTEASADAPVPGSDEPVIEKLRAGGFEMAVVPARAWSTAGVTSLRALQTPFLVQSDAQVDAIVRDDALVSDLFAGVGAVGVRGLTMFPESLRHLFSFTTPILTPADVTGRQVRYTSSTEVAHLIETLGATPVDPSGEDFASAVGDGTITAADSGFAIAIHTTPRPATATGNLVLYAKVITLVANAPFWDGLTDAQRTMLQTAADKAQEWAIANEVDDQAAATQYCADGGTVVLSDAGVTGRLPGRRRPDLRRARAGRGHQAGHRRHRRAEAGRTFDGHQRLQPGVGRDRLPRVWRRSPQRRLPRRHVR